MSYWKPIDTAPKDGTRILCQNKFGDISHAKWLDGDSDDNTIECWWSEQADDEWHPLWWAPALPEPDQP